MVKLFVFFVPLPVNVSTVVHFCVTGGFVGIVVACGACVALFEVVFTVVAVVAVVPCESAEPIAPHRASATTRTIAPMMSPFLLFFFGGVGGAGCIIGGCC